MSEWKIRRFWTTVEVTPVEAGFSVTLDARPVHTPAKRRLVAPTAALAEAVASEWRAQEETVDPRTMPFTRTVNAALDKVAVQHAEVAEMIAAYGDSDLLCYRAEAPESLVARQAEAWDPMLEWAADTFDARLEVRTGVMHVAQDPKALSRLGAQVHKFGNHELAAFHDLVSLTGSLILGLAAARDAAPACTIWDISRLDEVWQSEHWGKDDEAEVLAAHKRAEFLHAKQVFDFCQPVSEVDD